MAAENSGWVTLAEPDMPRLQSFLEANPEYWRVVMGTATPADAAREIFEGRPPDGWRWDRKTVLGASGADGALVAMADLIEGLFAPDIAHLGLFIVAGKLHGTGASRILYESLEESMHAAGARWMRLGVVVGNARAERFWEKLGFIELRRRYDIDLGPRTCDLRVMAKPLAGGDVGEYLALVERDRPD
ncbi:MAG TPA: GNAT family N-acetyltransferase [Usitatibacter sp.]|jgi:ribosomal protein S18 acetylase RimI-like enzyme|nr:GNAT family N-acetyltransferase [Usitatibacter sp.]